MLMSEMRYVAEYLERVLSGATSSNVTNNSTDAVNNVTSTSNELLAYFRSKYAYRSSKEHWVSF